MSNWEENFELIWNIIEELIEEENITNQKNIVYNEFNILMNEIYKKRYSYASNNIMNKEILSMMNDIITNIKINLTKKKKKVKIEEIYNKEKEIPITNDEIRNERNKEIQSEYELRQRELNNMLELKPPDEIDFSDKVEDDNKNIDNLMEEELKKRSYELMNISKEYDSNKANEWIYNGNKENKNINMSLELINEKEIDKEEKNEEEKSKSINNFLSKLKRKHNSIKLNLKNEEIILNKTDKNYINEINYYKLENVEKRIIESIEIENKEIEYKINEIKKKIKINILEINEIELIINEKRYKLYKKENKYISNEKIELNEGINYLQINSKNNKLQ
jgi:hypothetical protein